MAPGEPYYTRFVAGSDDLPSVFWTPSLVLATIAKQARPCPRWYNEVPFMLAVVGNLIAGLGMLGLFTATLRITRAR